MGHQKKPGSKIIPPEGKVPRTSSDPSDFYKQNPCWQIGVLQMASRWGWHTLNAAEVTSLRDKLAHFESMTWREILVNGADNHHRVKTFKLCGDAQHRLLELFSGRLDVEELVSLRLSSQERVWGILRGRVLSLLWWDPEHEVYPVPKRYT